MKTFKIAGFFINDHSEIKEVELIDGLIINREDEHRSWLIEVFMSESYNDTLQKIQHQEEAIEVHALITHPDNDPAIFSVQLREVTYLTSGISAIFEGRLLQMRNEYAKQVLADLIEEGVSDQDLLDSFNTRIQKRKNVPISKRTAK
ncbi:hypothetical protein JOC78_001324 [Bacillus ectoiniformans]|uniref:YwpF family protein n=1 Tax=Bacillus ectoiniformans TaxID=1494429 RepID=UPI001958D8E8|nr:YwpF family protein [Bacillus ectoiniformans]MBM7648382.1 hypothetical protein [Bacillus ectoiniformans]